MNITEKKQTHRYIENKLVVTSGKKAWAGTRGGRGFRDTDYYV